MTATLPMDATGLAMTAGSPAVLEAWESLLDGYCAFSPALPDHLRALLAAGPDTPMAHVARAALMLQSGKAELLPVAAESAALAERLAASATARERLHARAVAVWSAGHDDAALGCWEAILAQAPRDLFALKLAQFGHFYAGGGDPMLRSVEQVAGQWDAGVPRYGCFLGVRAFALEESGQLEAAERTGREACEHEGRDPWAIHAVAHCLETRNAPAEGIDWIDSQGPGWRGAGTMDGHLRWHRALFALKVEGAERVAEEFESRYRVPDSVEYLDLCNDVALLERLAMAGVELPELRAQVAAALSPRARDHLLAFCDVHWVLGYAAAGRFTDAEAVLEGMLRRAATGGPEADRYRMAGVPLAGALIDYHRGEYRSAAEQLAACADRIRQIGGSHAQRALFHQLRDEAGRRAGTAASGLDRIHRR